MDSVAGGTFAGERGVNMSHNEITVWLVLYAVGVLHLRKQLRWWVIAWPLLAFLCILDIVEEDARSRRETEAQR